MLRRTYLWLLVAGLATAQASAKPLRRVSLNWVRGEGALECLSSQQIAERVEERLGQVFVAPSYAQLSIEAQISKQGDGFLAIVAVTKPDGEVLGRRELKGEGPDCRALDTQLVFLVMMMVDPEAGTAELPEEFAGLFDHIDGHDPLAVDEPPATAQKRTKPAPRKKQPLRPPDKPSQASEASTRDVSEDLSRWGLGAGPATGFRVQPSLSFGALLHASYRATENLSVAAQTAWWLPQDLDGAPASAAVVLSGASASALGCWGTPVGRLQVAGCVGTTLLYRWTSTSGSLSDEGAKSLRVGPAVRLRLELEFTRHLALGGSVGVDFPLGKDTFFYGNRAGSSVPLYATAQFSAIAGLVGMVRF